MWQQNFISQLLRDKWCIRPSYIQANEERVRKIILGDTSVEAVQKESFTFRTNTSHNSDSGVGYNDAQPGSVAIISIRDVLFRYDTWCDYGAETYKATIQMALDSQNISAIVLALDTPGGACSAATLLEPVLKKSTKPIVSFVDDMAFSAGYWIAALSTRVVASNDMAEVGSIGVMATLYDYREADKEAGVKVLHFYPDESPYKNKAVRDALDGKPEMLQAEQLSPFAKYFQDAVRTGRPKLNEKVEGILGGKEFYAKDAKEYGLVDEIMTLEDTIGYALELADMQDKLSTL